MAFNWNKFPWTTLHDLNLDWIIQKVKELSTRVGEIEVATPAIVKREINELTTGAGDLEIDKTGSVRISGGTVDLSNAHMATDLDMVEHRIINVGAPVSGTDAVNKTYVDSLEGGGTVLRGTATFNSDGRITLVEGIDYSAVAAAALANVNILLVLAASNVEETYIVMSYAGKKQLATSGTNRYRYTFTGSLSNGANAGSAQLSANMYGLDFDEGDDPLREKDLYWINADYLTLDTLPIYGGETV